MKICFILGLILTGQVFADRFADLDQAQEALHQEFLTTQNEVGSANSIRETLKSGSSEEIRNSVQKIADFFAKYDAFNMAKIDTFLNLAMEDAKRQYQLMLPQIPQHKLKDIDKKMSAIELNFKNYQDRKKNLGKELDYQRVESGRDFINGVGNLSNEFRLIQGQQKNRTWGVVLLPFIDNLKEFAPVSDDFMKLLYNSYFKAKKNKPNQAPIVDSLRKIALELAKARGTETKWYGLEKLGPMPLDGKTLNVLVFMHANSYFDTSVQASLPLEGLSSIGNVDVIFPKFLAKQMIKSDHIITVGHGDTMTKTVNVVKQKKLNKFFIAPEGMTPVGFYEMRPFIDDFAGSIYESIARGLEVNIYPISFPENFRFLNDFRRPIEGNKLAYGIIHPYLTTEDFKKLLEVTADQQSASHVIRWIWFGDLINDENHSMGMPRPTMMKQWYEDMIWGNL